MKKKDAIERLAAELEARDQRAFERATEAAGNAASVIQVVKDYKALAKEHMDRALIGLAFNRAMSELDRPSALQEKAAPPLLPPHTHRYAGARGHAPFNYTPLDKLRDAAVTVDRMIENGWAADEMCKNGYIAL